MMNTSPKEPRFTEDRQQIFSDAEIILQVRAAGALVTEHETGAESSSDLDWYHAGQTLIAQCDPLSHPAIVAELAKRNVTSFSLELVPRITRAQSMDVLSSMATIAGYKAVLQAANLLPRMFPMLMTAAGTITAAKVFVMGAGVAGLSSDCHCQTIRSGRSCL